MKRLLMRIACVVLLSDLWFMTGEARASGDVERFEVGKTFGVAVVVLWIAYETWVVTHCWWTTRRDAEVAS